MWVQRNNHRVAFGDCANKPFNNVAVHVWCVALNCCWQVQNEFLRTGRLNNCHHRFANFNSKLWLGECEAFRRILVSNIGSWKQVLQVFAQLRGLHRNVNYALLVEPEYHSALQWVGGVIEVHDCALRALQAFIRALQQIFTTLHQHLNGHIVGNEVLLNEQANEIKIWLRSRRKANFNFFEAHFDERVEHAQFALGVHWVDERLVAVAKVD